VWWDLKLVGLNKFSLQTKSFDSLAKWGTVFEIPLKQYIERVSAALVNPYGPTAYVPVTYYDYHSNRTNPEFEQPCCNQVNKNMVGDLLDSLRKPVLGSNPCMNYCIAKWFRPWTPDSIIPVYFHTVLQYTTVNDTTSSNTLVKWLRTGFPPWDNGEWGNGSCNEVIAPSEGQNPQFECTYPLHPANDTAFKNIVIPDSLRFTLIDSTTGTYQFNQSGFWPLDNRGFGNEWTKGYQMQYATTPTPDPALTGLPPGVWPHNFAFTMEMKRTFIMVPGLVFQFTGDDDIWLFLNNRLEMDLGGPHTATSWTVNVDTCGYGAHDTLHLLQTYNFDFFYCERHSVNSDCEITTNLLEYLPRTTKQRHWQRDYGTLN
jgi:fibro-slime domain-containing protein